MALRRPRTQNPGPGEPDLTIVEVAESQARRTTLVVLGILIIITAAAATYLGVKSSLKQMRGVNLQSRLDAELRALDVWVAQRSNVVERWAEDERTRAWVAALVARNGSASTDPSASCTSREAEALRKLLRPALEVRRFDTFAVVDRSGLIVASHDPKRCGLRVSTSKFLAALERTFAGESSFLRPFTESERLPARATGGADEPHVWFEAPVRAPGGEPIAALGFAEPARAEFASLLRAARAGQSDEIYLFDGRGTMLSDSRHAARLAEAGLLGAGEGSMLRVQVRDPGPEPEAIRDPAERAAQPLTRLAAVAIAARESGDPARQRGVLLEPYRNYFGAEVLGAWRWLPGYDFGAALELDAGEAYAPVAFLERAFGFVVALSALALVGIVLSLRATLRLRRGLGSFRKLGHYRLVRPIAEGGMASIYLGRHALLKRPIAIKILKHALATDEVVARFEREVQLASQLSHPNSIEIYDYGRTRAGDFYYVMEYLDGITLAELVACDGALVPGRAIHLLRQVCAALKETHARGVVHRDIKPENVMVCVRGGEYDVVKVLDFGLVKSLRDEESRDVTGRVRIVGTPAYMAPERFGGDRPVDERADVYGVGAVGYLLLAGKRMFHDASGEALQLRILHAQPAPPSRLCGEALPAELEALILRCLAKDPDARPATMAAVLVTLEALASSHPWTQAQAEAWWQHFERTRAGKAQETV